MDYPEGKYWKTVKVLLWSSGLWPHQDRKSALIFRTIVIVVMISALFFQVATYATYKITSDLIIELMPLTISTVGMIFGYFYFQMYFEDFKHLFSLARSDWLHERYKEEYRIKISYARLGKILTDVPAYTSIGTIFTLYYPFCIYSPQIMDYVMPLENGTREIHQFVFHLQFFVDNDEYYYLIVFHSFCVLLVWLIVVIGLQCTYILQIFHGYGMFAALSYRLQVAHLDLNEMPFFKEGFEEYAENMIFRNVLLCAQRHHEVINYVDKIEAFYGPSISLCLAGLFVALCPTLVRVTSTQLIDYQYVVFFIGQIIFMVSNAYIGQNLIDRSEDIYVKSYFSDWCNFSNRSRKVLILIIQRSCRPCKITAHKLFDLSLENLRVFVRTILSYYTVIRKVRQ